MSRLLAAPAEVRAAVALAAAAVAACLFSAAFPPADGTPVTLLLILAVVSAAVGMAVWVLGPRVTPRWLVCLDAFVVVAVSVLVGFCVTSGGAMLSAYPYFWLTVYTGLFLSRRAVWLTSALITAGFGAGLLASGLPGMLAAWVLVSATAWAFGFALVGLAERLRRHAETDLVTGLPNRRAFVAAAEREHDLAARTGADLSAVLIDLDHFKDVNDRDGHAAGDRLLADLAAAWKGALRPADLLGRHGGDEFALVLPATSEQGATRVVARLHAAHPMTWSSGVTAWEPGESLDTVLARADARLYAVKRAKRRFGEGGGAIRAGRSGVPMP